LWLSFEHTCGTGVPLILLLITPQVK